MGNPYLLGSANYLYGATSIVQINTLSGRVEPVVSTLGKIVIPDERGDKLSTLIQLNRDPDAPSRPAMIVANWRPDPTSADDPDHPTDRDPRPTRSEFTTILGLVFDASTRSNRELQNVLVIATTWSLYRLYLPISAELLTERLTPVLSSAVGGFGLPLELVKIVTSYTAQNGTCHAFLLPHFILPTLMWRFGVSSAAGEMHRISTSLKLSPLRPVALGVTPSGVLIVGVFGHDLPENGAYTVHYDVYAIDPDTGCIAHAFDHSGGIFRSEHPKEPLSARPFRTQRAQGRSDWQYPYLGAFRSLTVVNHNQSVFIPDPATHRLFQAKLPPQYFVPSE